MENSMKKLLFYLLLTSFYCGSYAMQPEDDSSLYGQLRIARDASFEEIKTTYRELSLKYHPDRDPAGDYTEEYKKITAAYSILGDPEKRRIYDQEGLAGLHTYESTTLHEKHELEEFENIRQQLKAKFEQTHTLSDIQNIFNDLIIRSNKCGCKSLSYKATDIFIELATLFNMFHLNNNPDLNKLNYLEQLTTKAITNCQHSVKIGRAHV
jgi:DnaJ-class molecular chaperone